MSEAAPAATAGPPVTADAQDPLPESKWGWRRGFTIATVTLAAIGTAVAFTMLYYFGSTILDLIRTIAAVRDSRTLDNALRSIDVISKATYGLGIACVIVWTIAQLLYLIAPSAEQIVKMLQMVQLFKMPGFSMSSVSAAQGPAGAASSTSVAGQGAPPIIASGEPVAPAAPVTASQTNPPATEIME